MLSVKVLFIFVVIKEIVIPGGSKQFMKQRVSSRIIFFL
jgi:hypothetical protein